MYVCLLNASVDKLIPDSEDFIIAKLSTELVLLLDMVLEESVDIQKPYSLKKLVSKYKRLRA